MGISSDLQRLIVARLKAAVPSVAGRVYDAPPESAVMPYITIGPSYWFDDSADCVKARVETVQVDIWTNRKPNRALCKDIADEVAAALDGWSDTSVLNMHPVTVEAVRVMDDPDPTMLHGVVEVEVMLE